MKREIFHTNNILIKRLFNTMFFGILCIVVITAYYTSVSSKAKEIFEINAIVTDADKNLKQEEFIVKTSNEEEKYFLEVPERVNEKFVLGYRLGTEDDLDKTEEMAQDVLQEENVTENNEQTNTLQNDNTINNTTSNTVEQTNSINENIMQTNNTTNTSENIAETTNTANTSENIVQDSEESTINNLTEEVELKEENAQDSTNLEEIVEYTYDILAKTKIELTEEQIEKKQIILVAKYDTKQVNEEILYNKYLVHELPEAYITMQGYMPENAVLKVVEVDLSETEQKIINSTGEYVELYHAYDIKIVVDDVEYEPYEFDENVQVEITLAKQDEELSVWHIDENDDVMEVKNELKQNSITFETDSFSIYGIGVYSLVPTITEPDTGLVNGDIIINDLEADWYYYMGQNYTADISGENQNIYTENDMVKLTINYHGYANGNTNADMIGYVSLTERQSTVTYYKYLPKTSNVVNIELIDNPFIDRPTGYGFGGWSQSAGTLSTDSNTKVQSVALTVSGNEATLDIYANWITATVVYVNGETGLSSNNGLTPETPFDSWGTALNYLRNNSTDINDRERNIIVMTGNMEESFNYTTPVTVSTTSGYESSTTVSTGTYILATGTGEGANAITVNGTSITNTSLAETGPSDNVKWEIISTGTTNRYYLRNVETGQYLAYSNGLTMQDTAFVWRYNNRRFYSYVNYRTSYYIIYNNGWTTTTTQNQGQQFYFLTYTQAGQFERGSTSTNSYYTSSTNVAFTLTGAYGDVDYRDNATWNLTNSSYNNLTVYNDFQMEYINVNATGYTSNPAGTTFTTTTYPLFLGRANNVRIGRGIVPVSTDTDASVFGNIVGGTDSGSTGSTTNDDNAYRLVVESGKYSAIIGFNRYGNTSSYYGTVYLILGSDIDRAINNNENLSVYARSTVNSGNGVNGKSNVKEKAFEIYVKSGRFGIDCFEENDADTSNRPYAGIYVGGHGSSAATSTRDISERFLKVEGGEIANIIGGLKVYQSSLVDTKIYVTGGNVKNIVGGAGYTLTYGDRFIQVTGGTVEYNVSAGSNGAYANSATNNGKLEGNTLIYIGGTAQIGTAGTLGTSLYNVTAGNVLGAGNGTSNTTYNATSGQVTSSHVIVNDEAVIRNSVYGGGNYGIVGASGNITTAKVDILGGTVEGNVYGGANMNNMYVATIMNVKGGHIKGALYGGSNASGTISSTSTINVTGGTLGINTNTSNNPVLFGGGYGSSTVITGNATINISDDDDNINIYGSVYGGSSLGSINSNTVVNVSDSTTSAYKTNIVGSVFAGAQGNTTTSATINGNSTLNVNGGSYENCSFFGGNDINGTTQGAIRVNIGDSTAPANTITTSVGRVYGGGNQADITTATDSVYVYLYPNTNVNYAFNGGKEANLLSSNTSDTTRTIYLLGGNVNNLFGGSDTSGTVTVSNVEIQSGNATNIFGGNNEGGTTNVSKIQFRNGTAQYVYGGNNLGGITTTSNVNMINGEVTESIFGGGDQAETGASNVNLTAGKVKNVFGGGYSADVTTASVLLSGTTITNNIYGGSNQNGTVSTTYLTLNSGSVNDVFGGNNEGGTAGTTNVDIGAITISNVYGGGNNATTTGNTNVLLTNTIITGSAYGGGNGDLAIVQGDNTIKVNGTTNIAGNLFGGGNAAPTRNRRNR